MAFDPLEEGMSDSSMQRPSILKNSSMSQTTGVVDCRTRSYVMSKKRARFGSASTTLTTSSNHAGAPAAIYEHRRGGPTTPTAGGDPLNRSSVGWNPKSFQEIEDWLQKQADEAVAAGQPGAAATDDGSSAIKILFINEKRCDKEFSEEVCDVVRRLHPILKIYDWTTAHYMSTFCRFPVPLEVELDEDGTNSSHTWDYRYSISHPFDWDMIWAYFPSTRTTVGILRTWFDNYGAGFQEMEDTIDTFSGPTLAHPALLGLFALQLLTSDTMANVREKGNRIYEAQTSTGFHVYTHLRSTEFNEVDDDSSTVFGKVASDLSIVSKEVLGAASNLTGWENACAQLVKFADFLSTEATAFAASPYNPAASGRAAEARSFARLTTYIREQATKQVSDLDGADRDAKAWLATAQFLMQGVLNMLSQRDAQMNFKLARSSNKIAVESKRDSTSMKALAVVTMFFLPATFTAVSGSDLCSPHTRAHPRTHSHMSVHLADQ